MKRQKGVFIFFLKYNKRKEEGDIHEKTINTTKLFNSYGKRKHKNDVI